MLRILVFSVLGPQIANQAGWFSAEMGRLAVGLFPDLVVSHPFPENSLTIYNAASSVKTLRMMLYIAAIGVPFVLAYTISIYWVFRGKVKLDELSY